MPIFNTTPATDPVELTALMLGRLTPYYPRESRNTNFYRFLSAYGDIMTDIDYEVDYTILDTGVDEAREPALFPNFGYFYTLPIRGDLIWGWDDYKFMLKVLGEAWTIYGSTAFGMRRVTQVVTGISPMLFEHYRYAGWILGQSALGVTVIVESGDYIWNTVSRPSLAGFDLRGVWPQQQTSLWVCGDDGAAGIVWRSTNAGGTWQDANPPVATIYYGIHGIGPQETWTCGAMAGNGVVDYWHWIDGWTATTVAPGITLRGIWMRTSQDGWVVGDTNTVYHWDGTTWTLTAMPAPVQSLFAVHGLQSGWVYVVGNSSKVVVYDPNTLTWTDCTVAGPVRHFRAVHVIDADTAWVCGLNGVVNWTTDGGATWGATTMAPAVDLNGIWVSADGQDIRITGSGGSLFYSSDGGTTWDTETYQGSGVDLNAIYMRPNDAMGYICGDNGVILRRNGQSPGYILADGTVVANGELIDGIILESRHGRRNSVDAVVWNVMDYDLLWRFLNDMKPAHVKLFLMFEYPFVMDYYYYDPDFYTNTLDQQHLLIDVNSGEGTVVNGRSYGESMSRIVVSEVESYIPQLA